VALKYLIILMLVLIVGSLGKALFHLSGRGQISPSEQQAESRKMVRALTFRIGLSVALFVLLMIAYYEGWIAPH
jgi:DUF2909 family protein